MTNFSRVFALALFLFSTTLLPGRAYAQEAVIGKQTFDPGLQVIFEGAIKDDVTPHIQHLAEDKTDIHLEARVTWAADKEVEVPEGARRGGFVPYLRVWARIINERTGQNTFVTLVPHINLGDNMHYARNVALPGARDDTYRLRFRLAPPEKFDLSFHEGFRERYGDRLFKEQTFTYEGLDFEAVAEATRP